MVSIDDFDNLVKHTRGQDELIRTLRLNLDQAGHKLLALEANKKQSKHAHINFGKALCPDAYDGNDAGGFRTWQIKVANYLSNDDNDMVEELLDWAGKHKEEITKNEFDAKATDEGWDDNQEHTKFSKVLYRFLLAKTGENANRVVQNGNPGDGVDAWRRLVFQYDPNLASMSQCHLKMILSIARAKDANEAVSNIQKLEEYIRKNEKNRDRELDEEIKVQRMYDILPANIEKHLILESRDKEANYEDIRRGALTWVMTHTSGRLH